VLASFISTPDQLLGALEKKANKIEERLDQQTAKYLFRFQKQERRLYKKLVQRDSLLARQLFDGVAEKYKELQKAPSQLSKYAAVYSGHLDSLTTSLQFFKANGLTNSLTLDETLLSYTSLESKLNQADAIKKYVGERQKLLKEQLQNLRMVKELRGFQKQAYYYQAQIRSIRKCLKILLKWKLC
jgi:CII-binding regulator of phage lambda lysogenization HflD